MKIRPFHVLNRCLCHLLQFDMSISSVLQDATKLSIGSNYEFDLSVVSKERRQVWKILISSLSVYSLSSCLF